MKRSILLRAGLPARAPLLAALVLVTSQAAAQEEEKKPEEKKEAAEEVAKPWYQNLELSAFVDTYFSVNFNFPKPNEGTNALRGNDPNNGFSLAQGGVDLTYQPGSVGGTINLRFGPQALAYAGGDVDSGLGLQYLRQAYVTWKPVEIFTIDFGKWDTFAGGELIDSTENFNYTRGVVHWLAQPTFHTGLRLTLQPVEPLTLIAFVANGWNRSIDNNTGKTFGLQVGVTPVESFTANLGYITGPEQDDLEVVEDPPAVLNQGSANERFKHLIDLVVTFKPTEELSLALNGDLGFEQLLVDPLTGATDYVSWAGVMLGARYAFTEHFATALRGEYYRDPDGYTTGATGDISLITGTLTVEASPDPHFIVKLDGRIDKAFTSDAADTARIFQSGIDDTKSIQPTITLGVVAKTN